MQINSYLLKMKIFLVLVMIFSCMYSYADLAKAKSCSVNKDEECKLLLIGTIDTLSSSGFYCPDGKASYGYIIDSWRKDLELNSNLQKLSTHRSVEFTITKLGLSCMK
jgi:hypothetical protein